MMNLDLLWGKMRRGAGNNNFSYGLASIAACLIKHGYEVEILDPQFMKSQENLISHMRQKCYDIIGITSYTPTIMEAFNTANVCRRALPDSVIVMGGPHCTYFPEETLRDCDDIDYVVAREGEETMVELARMIEGGRQEPKHILGLTWRDNDQITSNQPRPFLDVDKLPTPAYHLFPLDKYSLQPTIYKRLPTLTTLVSRGCPYSCTFCHGFEILGRKTRYRDVALVLDELELLITDYAARGFMFYDSTFTCNGEWVESFCEEILRRGLDIVWMCLTRSDRVSAEMLSLMRRAGCWAISFGVESASQKSLDMLKKNVTVQQNREAILMAKQASMFVTATYMIGLPGEDEKDVLRTIEFAKENPTHIAHFFWPIPYPKTLFYEQCKEDGGLVENPRWENFNLYAERPVYANPRIGFDGMRRLQRHAFRSYYTSPRVVVMNLRSISSLTDVWKYGKAALALSGMLR